MFVGSLISAEIDMSTEGIVLTDELRPEVTYLGSGTDTDDHSQSMSDPRSIDPCPMTYRGKRIYKRPPHKPQCDGLHNNCCRVLHPSM